MTNINVSSSALLFGDTHGYLKNERKTIQSIIKQWKPNIILYERLEDKQPTLAEALKKKPSEQFSLVSTYADIQPILRIAYNTKTPVKGCDLPALGRTKPIPETPTEKELRFEAQLLRRREKQQRKILLQTLEEYQRVLLITGAYHLRTTGSLRIPGCILVQPTYNGKIVYGLPKKNTGRTDYRVTKI